jgi:hypothetical protein
MLHRPERVGVVGAQAESLKSVAAVVEALALDMRLIDELRHRLPPD